MAVQGEGFERTIGLRQAVAINMTQMPQLVGSPIKPFVAVTRVPFPSTVK